MENLIKRFKSIENPFFIEAIESETDIENLKYKGRGEPIYADGRQVLVRSCHDALVGYNGGILLVIRNAEPAKGYLWSLGGFFDRGVPTETSLISRVKEESGLDLDVESFKILGHMRAMWKNTPNKEAAEKGLPLGI